DVEADRLAVLADASRLDDELLLADLRPAVAAGGVVAELRHPVAGGQVLARLLRQRLGVGQVEAGLGDLRLEDVERDGVVGAELLQPVAQLAGLTPVAAVADAAEVEVTVGADRHLVDAGLQALGHAVHGALGLALDLLEVHALQAAVGNVADGGMPREESLSLHY